MIKVPKMMQLKDKYPYVFGDRLTTNRNTYFYTKYHGLGLFEAWRQVRLLPPPPHTELITDGLNLFKEPIQRQLLYFSMCLSKGETICTSDLLNTLYHHLKNDALDEQIESWIKRLIKKFEVCKRVHGQYGGKRFLAINKDDHKDLTSYIKLAYILSFYYGKNLYMPALNTFLKIMDSLNSCENIMEQPYRRHFNELHEVEIQFILDLSDKCGVKL